VTVVYSNDSTSLAVELVEGVMTEHPDLNGWFFVGLWAFLEGRGAMPLWEEATLDGQVYNVGFDTLPLQLDLMDDGFVQGLVGQKYWGWGYDTVQMLVDYVLADAEFESFTDSGMDIVTPLNLPAMRAAWQNCNFTVPLPDAFELDPDYEFDEADYTYECAD
jgi:ribose transport system substrate-binding protein